MSLTKLSFFTLLITSLIDSTLLIFLRAFWGYLLEEVRTVIIAPILLWRWFVKITEFLEIVFLTFFPTKLWEKKYDLFFLLLIKLKSDSLIVWFWILSFLKDLEISANLIGQQVVLSSVFSITLHSVLWFFHKQFFPGRINFSRRKVQEEYGNFGRCSYGQGLVLTVSYPDGSQVWLRESTE